MVSKIKLRTIFLGAIFLVIVGFSANSYGQSQCSTITLSVGANEVIVTVCPASVTSPSATKTEACPSTPTLAPSASSPDEIKKWQEERKQIEIERRAQDAALGITHRRANPDQ